VGRRQRAGVEQVALHEQREVLSAIRASGAGLISDSASRSSWVAVSWVILGGAALLQVAIGEHRGRDLTARDIDHGCRMAAGQTDRVEYEHVALERAQRDAALRHRVDEVVVRDALEQRELADHAVVASSPGGSIVGGPIWALCWMAKFDISPVNGTLGGGVLRSSVLTTLRTAKKQTTSPPLWHV